MLNSEGTTLKMYLDYATYMKRFFPCFKVQKISVNAGFSCPNRDGTIGQGGCIYCDNTSFTPAYCFGKKGIKSQIEAGKEFFGKKYKDMKFLVYFQSYTNTGSRGDVERLRRMYMEALDVEDVVGLIVGTRPDCVAIDVTNLFEEINRTSPVFVELGVESCHDPTLRLINRGHSWADTVNAVNRLADAGLHVGVHIIAGLPGEDEDMWLETVKRCCELPIESLKLHHLQVIRGTRLHHMLEQEQVSVPEMSLENYMDFCLKAIQTVPGNICIERFLASSPPDKVLMPKWGLKNYQFVNILKNKLKHNS